MKSLRKKENQQKLCKLCHRKYRYYGFAKHKCTGCTPNGDNAA